MHKATLVLTCVAFAANSLRVETSYEQAEDKQLLDFSSNEQVSTDTKHMGIPLKALALVPLAFVPSTAFGPQARPLAVRPGPAAASLAHSTWFPRTKWPPILGTRAVSDSRFPTLSMMAQPNESMNVPLSPEDGDAWLDNRFQMSPDETSSKEYTRMLVLDAIATPYLSSDIKMVPEGPEPFGYVEGDVAPLSSGLADLVQTDNAVLKKAATQLFSKKQQGKGFRPTLVTLMSLACADAPVETHRASEIYKRQGTLAQITEMIHVASLIHDDVLDEAGTRRGDLAVHQAFSNKVAILAGDYLLATASGLLASLGDPRVTQIMASALKSLVQGEIMQLQAAPEDYLDMRLYLTKSYYKTGSLVTLSARSAAVLGGHAPESDVTKAAEEYGYHLGLAYQIVDDVLDFTASTDTLGKPAGADMELGLATAPVLYAMERDPSLRPLIMRRFKKKGDVQKAFDSVQSDGGVAIEKARELAQWHAQRAVDSIYRLPPSDAREALVRMAHIVLTRAK